MLEYFSILIFVIIINIIPTSSLRGENVKLFFSVLLIFLFMALRVDFTPDYNGYKELFETIHSYGTDDELSSEIGFQLLNHILPSYRWVIIVTALFFCSSIYFLFKRYIPSRYWIFAFLVLFISKSMLLGNTSGIRNSIAVSAFIFSFYFLEYNKKILYAAILVVASFFHSSSLFFIPLIFINTKNLTQRRSNIIWVLIILFTFLTILLPNAINLLSFWLFKNVHFFSRYEYYLQHEVNYGIRGLSFVLIFFMLYMNIKTLKIQRLNPSEVLLIKLSLIFYIVMLLPGIGLLSRVYFYLSFPQLAGNIYVMRRINDKFFRWAYIFGMTIIPLMEFYQFSHNPRFEEFYLNYHSILFN